MRKYLFILLSLVFVFTKSYVVGQSQDSTEIGVVEHLGETIPLNLEFTNENDSVIQLSSVIDKPTILTLVYFDCPGLCSPLLDGVSDVIEKADLELGKDYQVITVSFNYNDTPEGARKKKKNFLRVHSKEHADAWKFMTGDSVNIYKLANAVGFKFKKTGVDYVHPAVITILSPTGKITRYLYGTHFLPFDVKMAIIEAQKGLERPTVNRVLEFCFSYDPQGKTYVFEVTKITGTVILFLAITILVILLVKGRRKRSKVN